MTFPAGLKQSTVSGIAESFQKGLNVRVRGVIRLEAVPEALPDEQTLRQVNQELTSLCLIYSDLEPWIDVPLDDFLLNLAGKMAHRLSPVTAPKDVSPSTFISEFLPQVFAALDGDQRRLVLVFDHFELLDRTDYRNTVGHELLPFLHKIRNAVRDIGLVVITRSKTQELPGRVIDFIKGSTTYKLPPEFREEEPVSAPPVKRSSRKAVITALVGIAIAIALLLILIGPLTEFLVGILVTPTPTKVLVTPTPTKVLDGVGDQGRGEWHSEGEVAILLEEGKRVARLGSPEFGCEPTEVDESRLTSSILWRFPVLETGEYELSFSYRVVTYEEPDLQINPFKVLLDGQVVLEAGNSSGIVNCSSPPASTDWQVFQQTVDLPKGDSTLEFRNEIDPARPFNTWTYIHNVELQSKQ